MTNKKLEKIKIPSANVEDQPATRKMLWLVRDELKSDIRSVDLKIGSLESKLESKISALDSRINALDPKLESKISALESKLGSRISTLEYKTDAGFKLIGAKFEELRSDYHGMHILLEEQNSNNRIVLEGLQALWQRQEKIENHISLPK
ncbi:MAG: hypothetical protein HY843_04040 [Bdellovibrio sp.]|nr:hypothetical protein [Bdellovibrio sp.]